MKITGKAWTGWIGECKCDKRCPMYIIPKPGEDGIFICDVLKKYFGKNVVVTIREGTKK